jgi:hypothetical protein
VVGEADQFPLENRRALGQGLTEANRYLAQYLATVVEQGQIATSLPPEKLAGLLNSLILGYGAIELTSEFHELWQDRADFLDSLVQLFLNEAVSPIQGGVLTIRHSTIPDVADLPAKLVHDILQQAKKAGHQDYALAYVLFAAGLNAPEVVRLERSQVISDAHQHVLQIEARQVPVNQWVLGKRYGSYVANPLTRWLKIRKDNQTALFLNAEGQPLNVAELMERWQNWTEDCVTPSGQPPSVEQAQQTWCIDMLLRGMSIENLSILTGLDVIQLQPYAQRAKERTAIAQATRLDQKPSQHYS